MQFIRSRRRWPRKPTSRNPKLMTVGYRVAGATEGRVVVDYKQNAWGADTREHLPVYAGSHWQPSRRL